METSLSMPKSRGHSIRVPVVCRTALDVIKVLKLNTKTGSLFSKCLGDKMMCGKHLLCNMGGFCIAQNECKVLGYC